MAIALTNAATPESWANRFNTFSKYVELYPERVKALCEERGACTLLLSMVESSGRSERLVGRAVEGMTTT